MLRIGLTGGIGTGKSAASKILEKLGAYIFDADKEAKRILLSNETIKSELISEFGSDIMTGDGNVDNNKLARVAFQDQDHQLKLNTIVHPYVFKEIDKNFDRELDNGKHDIFVVDAALVYESGADTHMDYVIVITALIKTRMERALARETLSREEILKRVDLQWPEEEKVALADFVIHNDGSEEELIKNITDIYIELV
ncbi:MAG: dephospho-CoA kinase [Candidatus Neomarinimicrobiota bacterium]|nr:dephospho-CoA kinase [Candidatus Neomarinimicrobiota bacterium]MEE3196252.1 dephospho-CoA kinase [Candidatus Neomarinimicrobiota bacterium]